MEVLGFSSYYCFAELLDFCGKRNDDYVAAHKDDTTLNSWKIKAVSARLKAKHLNPVNYMQSRLAKTFWVLANL